MFPYTYTVILLDTKIPSKNVNFVTLITVQNDLHCSAYMTRDFVVFLIILRHFPVCGHPTPRFAARVLLLSAISAEDQ